MRIKEITVGELPGFIKSEEFATLEPKPITPLRAISQFKNPAARPENKALVFAAENNTLLAFAGLLPQAMPGTNEPVFSNSGWWAHPRLGRKFGLPIFLKAFSICNQRMFLTDCTAHTKSILEKTGLFTFSPEITGSRFFLRFYSGDWLRRKGKNRLISALFSFVDKSLNALFDLRFFFLLNKNLTKKYSISASNTLNTSHAAFIEKHPGSSFLKQDSAKLNWAVQNPWITTKKEEPGISYPFTYRVENFKQEFLEIKKGGEIVALLLLSVRDNHASVPFIYFEKELLDDVAQVLWRYLFQIKSYSLVVFFPELRNALRKTGKMWLFQKNINRFAGYSKQMNSIFTEKKYFFQDGEGDVVFT